MCLCSCSMGASCYYHIIYCVCGDRGVHGTLDSKSKVTGLKQLSSKPVHRHSKVKHRSNTCTERNTVFSIAVKLAQLHPHRQTEISGLKR